MKKNMHVFISIVIGMGVMFLSCTDENILTSSPELTDLEGYTQSFDGAASNAKNLNEIPVSQDWVVPFWNEVTLDAIRETNTGPIQSTRISAIVHVSIYDAVNGIAKATGKAGYESYYVFESARPNVSKQAAAAAAAHTALSYLFPDLNFDQTLAEIIERLNRSTKSVPIQQGIKWGEEVANRIIKLRSIDGHDYLIHYKPCEGVYQPGCWTGEWGSANYAAVQPWTMSSPDEFRPPPPPQITSKEYAEAFNEVKELGRNDGNAERTAISDFWAGSSGSSRPPGKWNMVSQNVVLNLGTPILESARLFALLNLALADAGISTWDSKFEYSFWRPYHANLNANKDGNDGTTYDHTWEPRAIGSSPEYTSGLTAFAGAAATVLVDFVGSDEFTFELESDDNGETQLFSSFSEAAEQGIHARLCSGNHFRFSLVNGMEAGKKIGQHVISTELKATAPGNQIASNN